MAPAELDAADATLLVAWREEQRRIASEAVTPQTPSARIIAINERYKVAHPRIDEPFFVGGVDVSFAAEGSDAGDEAVAVYVILKYAHDTSYASPEVVHRASKWFQLTMPYIPSYLAFREIEPLMELIDAQLQSKPDLKPNVIMVDGNGQWHERRAGIATFVGVRTGIPTVGVGKTLYSIAGIMRKEDMHRDIRLALHQWHSQRELSMHGNDAERGLLLDGAAISTQANDGLDEEEEVPIDEILALLHRTFNGMAIPMKAGVDEVLAYALVGHGGNIPPYRRRPRVKGRGAKNPIYISVGSNISLEDAVALCAKLSIARIPEPVREADLYGRQLVRERS